jgi:2-methylaconitate cis-trans-isomerase PrpF
VTRAPQSIRRHYDHTHSRKVHHNVTPATLSYDERHFPAWFVRGGTSNGLLIHRDNLPSKDQWQTILPAAMGSPDAYGRQLDGMGSGISSTSKIMVLGPSSSPEVAPIEYTFVQVGIADGKLDMAGNCGNMSAAVGPVAWDWGLVSDATAKVDFGKNGEQWATVRMLNTNTSKVLVSKFKISSRGSSSFYSPDGSYALDGVPGSGSKITMSFLDPAGAKTGKALPSGNPIDQLQLPDGSTISASLVDVSNPGVFVSAESLGINNVETLTPSAIEADTNLKTRLEAIRRAGASKMGLDPETESVPKIVILFPAPTGTPSVHIRCQALSMGQAHKAVPLTLALCLGAAAQIPGTVAHSITGGKVESTVTIGHPSGILDVGTTMSGGKIVSAELLRTVRVLMKGDVYY